MARKNMLNSSLYKYLRYLYYFLASNLLFLLMTLAFWIVYISFPPILENTLFYLLGLIPMGMAIAGLMFAMGQFVRNNELNPVKDFFRGYRMNFKESFIFWMIQLVIMTILIVDVYYFLSKDWIWIAVIFAILCFLVLVFTLIGMSILVTFVITIKNLYKITVVLIFRQFKTQLFLTATLIAFLIILISFPNIASLFTFSITAFYFMKSNNPHFVVLAQEFTKESEVNE